MAVDAELELYIKCECKRAKVCRSLDALKLLKLPVVHIWTGTDCQKDIYFLMSMLRYAGESGGRVLQLSPTSVVQLVEVKSGTLPDTKLISGKFMYVDA